MWTERVEAGAFGPFAGEELVLGEGLNLVFGPNEAGKSSWSAALYSGICGTRRGRGRRASEDQHFESLHRPWNEDDWRVRAVIRLDNGSRVQLDHDLAARTGTARDLVTGRELTRQILTDQTPDASRWLGLDRYAFEAVACVPQGAMLDILTRPERLAEHLQRAAATAGADATAAEAIRRLSEFAAERIGTERSPTRPLARTIAALTAAEKRLDGARVTHADLASLKEQLHAARDKAEEASRRLQMAEAAVARRRADVARARWEQAAALADRKPGPPPGVADDDSLAQQVRVAIEGWHHRLVVAAGEGPSADELVTELDSLPEVPDGDLEPAAEVDDALRSLRDAQAQLSSLDGLEPPFAPQLEVPLPTGEMRRAAADLAEPAAEPDPALVERVERLRRRAAPHRPSRSSLIALTAGATLVVAGLAVGVGARMPVGWGLAALGLTVILVFQVAGIRRASRQSTEDLRQAEADLAVAHAASARTAKRHETIRARLESLGLPVEPSALEEIADGVDRAQSTAQQWLSWERRRALAEEAVGSATDELARILAARGARIVGDPEDSVKRYQAECWERARLARQACRRGDLEARLTDRRKVEGQVADAVRRGMDAERAVRKAARACGYLDADEVGADRLAEGLRSWLDRRAKELEARQKVGEDYARLQILLGGATLDELQEKADRLTDETRRLCQDMDPDAVRAADPGADPDNTLALLRRQSICADKEYSGLEATLLARSRGVASVPEAEEALSEVVRELERLKRLDRLLGRARQLLERAQDSVHRSIAPRLAESIAPHVVAVTAGRYTEVTVDPENLEVRVRAPSGTWRDATRLSHGTADQIYLLLHAALAEYLVGNGEPCPLVLDDPTAYADATRATAILDVLHRISSTRQVVLFSHDESVRAWIREHMAPSRDRIVELVETVAP